MLDANYIRHFKTLGKFCKLFDIAGANESEVLTLMATTYDQIADGTPESSDGVDIASQYRSRYKSGISNGATAQQTLAKNMASAYLISDSFVDNLTTQPTSRTAADVLAALQTEMGAGVDDKTLTTKAATGLVNFFDSMLAAPGTWNTEAGPTADYDDSVYVVTPVI